MLPDERSVYTKVRRDDGQWLDAMADGHSAVVRMLDGREWNITRRRGLSPFVVDVVMGLFVKALKTHRSIEILARRGLAEDGNALLRVLLETVVAALFILQSNSRQRAKAFHGYSLNQTLKMLREWQETPGLKRRVTRAKVAEVEAAVARAAGAIGGGFDFRRHWSGLGNLQNAVHKLGHRSLYAVLFRHTSAITHATDTGMHFEVDDTGNVVWQVAPRSNGVRSLSLTARELLLVLATRIDGRFGLGFEATLAPHRVTKDQLARASQA